MRKRSDGLVLEGGVDHWFITRTVARTLGRHAHRSTGELAGWRHVLLVLRAQGPSPLTFFDFILYIYILQAIDFLLNLMFSFLQVDF